MRAGAVIGQPRLLWCCIRAAGNAWVAGAGRTTLAARRDPFAFAICLRREMAQAAEGETHRPRLGLRCGKHRLAPEHTALPTLAVNF
jgi:hypothetical protein